MDPTMSIEEHNLWLNFSALGNGNVFAQLPKLIEAALESMNDADEDNIQITFPSDYEWKTKIYLKLLEEQKTEQKMEEDILREESAVLHDWNIVPPKNKKEPFCAPDAARLANAKDKLIGPGPIKWTVSDISKAGCLLCTPPLPTDFADEQEMRRVYTLIYDVYRYKSILSQALNDVAFFLIYPQLTEGAARVWLLLYDLYHRSFRKRTVKTQAIAVVLFKDAGLQDVECALWLERIKLAASVARLRIKHSALRLSQLLPYHLRDEKAHSHVDTTPVSCWINIKKVKNIDEITALIEKVLNVQFVDDKITLESNCFKWDSHCPHFFLFHPSIRTKLAQSTLVTKHKLIVQDRSFCLGPATFGKIVSDMQLTGSVIQSHVNSPRTTAYLASILSQNENIKKIIAFSAGNRKKEYENYFNDLGIKNILIYAEKLTDMPPDSNSFEEVIAVFATPPNSYSAVSDPIDLVCSRGGDLSMLEVLTETEDTIEGKKRVAGILDEQKKTLKFAMSKPQIQFILYETHSEIDAENGQMVQKTVTEINKCARIHHATIQGKLKLIRSTDEFCDPDDDTSNDLSDDSEEIINRKPVLAEKINDEYKIMKNVIVPDCDIFDVSNLPSLCPNPDACLRISKEGCYLALMQRKQVTRLDNKYLIQMAETRGLFGSNEPGIRRSVKPKSRKVERINSVPSKIRRKAKDIEVDRIAAPTMASIKHSKSKNSSILPDCCKRHDGQLIQPKVQQTRRWWAETTRHITNLRSSLVKQKVLPPTRKLNGDRTSQSNAKLIINNLVNKSRNIDELVAKSSKKSNHIPLYPKLRLTRLQNHYDHKIPVPITVTMESKLILEKANNDANELENKNNDYFENKCESCSHQNDLLTHLETKKKIVMYRQCDGKDKGKQIIPIAVVLERLRTPTQAALDKIKGNQPLIRSSLESPIPYRCSYCRKRNMEQKE